MRGLKAGLAGLVAAVIVTVVPSAFAGDPGAFSVESNPLGKVHGLTYRSATFSGSAFGNAYLAAVCPGEKVLTGGGGDTGDGSGNTWIIDAGPDWFEQIYVPPSKRKAFTTGIHSETSDPVNASSYAICAAPRGLRMRSKSRGTTVMDQPFSAKAKCKHGASVAGGGFYSEGNQDYVLASAPFDGRDKDPTPDDGWRAKIIAAQGDRTVFVYANCTKKMDLAYRQKTFDLGLGGSRDVSCPPDRAASGGGAAVAGSIGSIWKSRPEDGVDPNLVPDDGWSAGSTGALTAETWTVYAICKA
jgi:hypothetical protein